LKFSEVDDRLAAAYADAETAAREGVLTDLRSELEQVMTRVTPSDLSAAEVAGLLVILSPVDTRLVDGPSGRPRLHVV
jgi:hypothetical protein